VTDPKKSPDGVTHNFLKLKFLQLNIFINLICSEKWYESDEQEEDSDPVASTSPPRIDDAGSKKTVVATTLRNPTLSETATEKPSVKSVPTRRAGNRFRSRTTPKPEE